jgi:multiple sugar transport system permease protein
VNAPAGIRHAGTSAGSKFIVTGALCVFLLYTLLPIYYLVISSTKSNEDLFSTFGLWLAPDAQFLKNVHDLLAYERGIFVRWLLNSAGYAVFGGLGSALLATLAGYSFAKFRFRARRALFAVILGAIMIPSTALVIPLFLMLSKVGLVDTPWAFLLPSMVFPLGVYLMRVYIEEAVPDELLDAARIDGAGELYVLFKVVAPLIAPGFVTVLLLAFTATWNNYFLPLVVLTRPEVMPVTVGLAQWYQLASAGSGGQALFAIVITGSLMAILPVVAMFLLLQRYWKSGLASGSIK